MSDSPTVGGTGGTQVDLPHGTDPRTSEPGTAPLRYSVPEVARLLGISERAIRKRIDTNQLFAVKEDRAWVVLIDPETIPRLEPVPQVPPPPGGSTVRSTDEHRSDIQDSTTGTADVWVSTTVAGSTARETPEHVVPEPAPTVPPSADAVPVPSIDLTPLVNLVADLTRRNAELTEAATVWQIRAHDLEQRLKQLGSGQVGLNAEPLHDAPERAPEPPGRDEGVSEGHPSSWWARTWRRMTGA